jgi:hypothetical protein
LSTSSTTSSRLGSNKKNASGSSSTSHPTRKVVGQSIPTLLHQKAVPPPPKKQIQKSRGSAGHRKPVKKVDVKKSVTTPYSSPAPLKGYKDSAGIGVCDKGRNLSPQSDPRKPTTRDSVHSSSKHTMRNSAKALANRSQTDSTKPVVSARNMLPTDPRKQKASDSLLPTDRRKPTSSHSAQALSKRVETSKPTSSGITQSKLECVEVKVGVTAVIPYEREIEEGEVTDSECEDLVIDLDSSSSSFPPPSSKGNENRKSSNSSESTAQSNAKGFQPSSGANETEAGDLKSKNSGVTEVDKKRVKTAEQPTSEPIDQEKTKVVCDSSKQTESAQHSPLSSLETEMMEIVDEVSEPQLEVDFGIEDVQQAKAGCSGTDLVGSETSTASMIVDNLSPSPAPVSFEQGKPAAEYTVEEKLETVPTASVSVSNVEEKPSQDTSSGASSSEIVEGHRADSKPAEPVSENMQESQISESLDEQAGSKSDKMEASTKEPTELASSDKKPVSLPSETVAPDKLEVSEVKLLEPSAAAVEVEDIETASISSGEIVSSTPPSPCQEKSSKVSSGRVKQSSTDDDHKFWGSRRGSDWRDLFSRLPQHHRGAPEPFSYRRARSPVRMQWQENLRRFSRGDVSFKTRPCRSPSSVHISRSDHFYQHNRRRYSSPEEISYRRRRRHSRSSLSPDRRFPRGYDRWTKRRKTTDDGQRYGRGRRTRSSRSCDRHSDESSDEDLEVLELRKEALMSMLAEENAKRSQRTKESVSSKSTESNTVGEERTDKKTRV